MNARSPKSQFSQRKGMTAASLLAPDGFINATLLCQRFNFNLSQWLQAAATQQLINSEVCV